MENGGALLLFMRLHEFPMKCAFAHAGQLQSVTHPKGAVIRLDQGGSLGYYW